MKGSTPRVFRVAAVDLELPGNALVCVAAVPSTSSAAAPALSVIVFFLFISAARFWFSLVTVVRIADEEGILVVDDLDLLSIIFDLDLRSVILFADEAIAVDDDFSSFFKLFFGLLDDLNLLVLTEEGFYCIDSVDVFF